MTAATPVLRAEGIRRAYPLAGRWVEAVRGAMKPSDEQVAWAKRVIDATASNAGAVKVDGKMVDKPHLTHALRMLASRSGL